MSEYVAPLEFNRATLERAENSPFMQLALPKDRIQQALAELAMAERRGFLGCTALFDSATFEYGGLHVRGAPDNPKVDFGVDTGILKRFFFQDGRLLQDPSYTQEYEAMWEGPAGLSCRVATNNLGYRCGYVRVPYGHVLHGKHYVEVEAQYAIEVHGGLTFSTLDRKTGGWVLGFDCAHYDDAPDPVLVATMPKALREVLTQSKFHHGRVWTLDDVRKETERLAAQLVQPTPIS